MNEHFPEIPVTQRFLIPCGVSKADFVMDLFHLDRIPKSWILFDDYSRNLHAWDDAGGTGLKCYNGINGSHGTWKKDGVMWSEDLRIYLHGVMWNEDLRVYLHEKTDKEEHARC